MWYKCALQYFLSLVKFPLNIVEFLSNGKNPELKNNDHNWFENNSSITLVIVFRNKKNLKNVHVPNKEIEQNVKIVQ